MNWSNLLIFTGVYSGVLYSILGILAAKHLKNSTYAEKYINWTLWWCIDRSRYDRDGKIYCTIGSFVALVGFISWSILYINK